MPKIVPFVAALLCTSLHAQQPPASLTELGSNVSADELKVTIERLVGFGTRHTLSDTKSDTRGIGAVAVADDVVVEHGFDSPVVRLRVVSEDLAAEQPLLLAG